MRKEQCSRFLLLYKFKSNLCVCVLFASPRLICHHGIEFQLCLQLTFGQRFSQLDPLDLKASETTLLKAQFMHSHLISFHLFSCFSTLFHSPCHISSLYPSQCSTSLFSFLVSFPLIAIALLFSLFFFPPLFSCSLVYSGFLWNNNFFILYYLSTDSFPSALSDSLLSGMERQRPGTISPGMGPQSRLPSFPALPRPSGAHICVHGSKCHISMYLDTFCVYMCILALSFVYFNLSASSTFKNSFTLGKLLIACQHVHALRLQISVYWPLYGTDRAVRIISGKNIFKCCVFCMLPLHGFSVRGFSRLAHSALYVFKMYHVHLRQTETECELLVICELRSKCQQWPSQLWNAVESGFV